MCSLADDAMSGYATILDFELSHDGSGCTLTRQVKRRTQTQHNYLLGAPVPSGALVLMRGNKFPFSLVTLSVQPAPVLFGLYPISYPGLVSGLLDF